MSDDTDEQEFFAETEAVPNADDERSGPSDEPASANEVAVTQRKLQLQKMEDDKLLTDADIAVEGMSDDEKRQILWALRESLPQPSMENLAPASLSPPSGPSEAEEEEEEYLPEDPLHAPPVITVDDDGDQVCDSTTSAFPARSAKGRAFRRRVQAPDSASRQEAAEVARTRKSQRQQRKATDSETDGDACRSASEVSESGDGFKTDLLTRSLKKVTDKQRERMKLSSQQKEQGQTRFKDLYNKMSQSRSQQSQSSASCHLSPVRGGGEETAEVSQSSQDLFVERPSDEEELDANATSLEAVHSKGSTPSSDVIFSQGASADSAAALHDQEDLLSTRDQKNVTSTHDQKDLTSTQRQSEDSVSSSPEVGMQQFGDQGQQVEEEDLETQPPDELALNLEEEEGEEETVMSDGEEAEKHGSRNSSPVYPIQVTQPSRSSPQPHCSSRQEERISPSKLPSDDENDKRPLLHDSCFSWPPLPPVCHLQRKYRVLPRKRKEPPVETPSYFCPETHTPADYSKVILQMFDTYLLRFTQLQQCFKKLPWGKPVRAGQHIPGTLDWKKRGGNSFHFDLDEEEDFETGQPPAKKLSTERDWQKNKGGGLPEGGQALTQNRAEAVVADREDNQPISLGSAGDSAAEQAAYDAETQQLDTDDELPDLQCDLPDTSSANSGSKGGEDRRASPGPAPASAGSQSSDPRLDENGDLILTQPPKRKRRAETQPQESASGSETRTKRVCKSVQPSQHGVQKGDRSTQRLGIKRKQVSPNNNTDDPVCVSNNDSGDDDEVTFPRTKKFSASVKGRGFVHISTSSSNRAGSKLKLNVVHPRPRRGAPSENRSGVRRNIRVTADTGGSYYQPVGDVSSSADAKPGPSADVEESDDSVQFVEPTSLAETGVEEGEVHDVQARASPTVRDDVTAVADAASHSQPKEQVSAEAEETITCPICSKEFPALVIEQHASDCTGEEDTAMGEDREGLQEPHRQGTALTGNPSRRRPLHPEREREEFVCGLCNLNMGGSSALKRHFERCKQRFEGPETACSSSSRPAAATPWLSAYRIPKHKDTSKGNNDAKQYHSEEEVGEIEEYSDDSCKDPDFTVTKDDKRQEKEDMSEDDATDEETGSRQPDMSDDVRGDEGKGSSFQPISKLKDSPIDFKNQFARKQRRRGAKPREKQ